MQTPPTKSTSGYREWRVNDKFHRLDGPAREWGDDDDKEWWANGELHRLDGPACEYKEGDNWWCVKGKRLSGPLELLKHGANWKDIAEWLTPREIAQCRTQK